MQERPCGPHPQHRSRLQAGDIGWTIGFGLFTRFGRVKPVAGVFHQLLRSQLHIIQPLLNRATDTAQKEGAETVQKDATGVEWVALPPYKQPAYRQEAGLMANGDVMTDFSAAIKAIGAGRRAAASIHQTMYGIDLDLPEHVVAPDTPVQNVHQVSLVPMQARQLMPVSDGSLIAKGAELEQGFDAAQAGSEANRCLQCGLICYLHESEPQEKQPEAAVR